MSREEGGEQEGPHRQETHYSNRDHNLGEPRQVERLLVLVQ